MHVRFWWNVRSNTIYFFSPISSCYASETWRYRNTTGESWPPNLHYCPWARAYNNLLELSTPVHAFFLQHTFLLPIICPIKNNWGKLRLWCLMTCSSSFYGFCGQSIFTYMSQGFFTRPCQFSWSPIHGLKPIFWKPQCVCEYLI